MSKYTEAITEAVKALESPKNPIRSRPNDFQPFAVMQGSKAIRSP